MKYVSMNSVLRDEMGYKQVNQIFRSHIASSALAVRATTQTGNAAIESPNPSLQGNETVYNGLTISIVEMGSKFL